MPQQLEKLQYKRQAPQFQGIYIDDALTIVKNNIAEVRRARGINQNQLAELLCVNVSYLYRVEAQKANMAADLLIATARILDVGVSDLLAMDCPASLQSRETIKALEEENKALKRKLEEINRISST